MLLNQSKTFRQLNGQLLISYSQMEKPRQAN